MEWGARTYVMAILNITPDSFSGDGLLASPSAFRDLTQAAVERAERFIAHGADILDVGGESTRPGSSPISAEEEMERILPVVRAVRAATDATISVDTYRATVAEAALDAGADWVNDVWGLRMDPAMPALIARAGCPVVIMHNRSKPKNVAQEERLGGRYVGIAYDDLIADVMRELQESVDLALSHGVRREQIIVDPGIGFGKTVEQNLQLVNQLHRLRALGFPILLGPSRKSFIGYTLNLPPERRRSVRLSEAPIVEGAIAAAVRAAGGASLDQVARAALEARSIRKLTGEVEVARPRRPATRSRPRTRRSDRHRQYCYFHPVWLLHTLLFVQ